MSMFLLTVMRPRPFGGANGPFHLVSCRDGRSQGARGRSWRRPTFPNCGSKYELTVLSRCTSFIRTRRRRSW